MLESEAVDFYLECIKPSPYAAWRLLERMYKCIGAKVQCFEKQQHNYHVETLLSRGDMCKKEHHVRESGKAVFQKQKLTIWGGQRTETSKKEKKVGNIDENKKQGCQQHVVST